MKIRYLTWDSDFYAKKIGAMNIENDNHADIASFFASAKKEGYVLLYLFIDSRELIDGACLTEYNGSLVDIKILYRQELQKISAEQNIAKLVRYQDGDDVRRLYQLAYQSGEYSRFRLDAHFSEKEFQSLYSAWIDNSIRGTLADEIFLYKENSAILGIVTVKLNQEKGVIGLMAVDQAIRGKGIGKALINQVKKYLIDHDIYKLEVATQQANQGACRFYEANGLSIAIKTAVYHFWL